MSVSKIFHTLIGDKSIVLENTEFHSDYIIFHGRIQKRAKKCSCCNSTDVTIKETKERTLRTLNIENKKSYLKLNTFKLHCHKCGKRAWMKLPFTHGKLPLTNSFIYYIVQLTAICTLLAVALFLGLHWTTVKNIDKANLAKRSKQFSFKKLRYISVDEIAIRKGHKYMTIFTDIATGKIIFAVEGRSEEVLRPFLKQLAKKAKRLRGIGIDMSAAYASSIKKHLPKVDLIFDRFHVTKLLNDTIDKIRRSEYAKCKDNGLAVLKGQRFLLLRNFVDLDEGQRSNLQKLLEINRPLAIAHSMKEQFRSFWSCSSKREGARFLGWWIIEALESGVELLEKTARTLLYRNEGLLSYFDHRIDNGKAEGINNKIKVLKRQAYGFHDMEYFKLRLYHLHKKECQLVG
ncbi:MAG: ISL3 family transposase [Candidatus Protochlamydia sp.]|nr:ISL3 family transposase [Candidatus Protochlamydia sp.]MBA3603833.1 ISL3 family transposase [Parachlamydiaceae bacterium]